MKKLFLVVLSATALMAAHAQASGREAILQILHEQTISWNKGDIDKFMKGYWNNDSLEFVGKSGITYGYTNTLNNYKKNYSDAAKMGQLSFDILKIQQLAPDYCYVLGKWFLKRSAGDVGGYYTLLFRKIKGNWCIVSDHSS